MSKRSVNKPKAATPRFVSQFARLYGRDARRPSWLRRLTWLAVGLAAGLAAYDLFGH